MSAIKASLQLLIVVGLMVLPSACQNKEAVTDFGSLKEAKIKTQKLIEQKDFQTKSLLEMQKYFFSIYEQLNLLKLNQDDKTSLSQILGQLPEGDWCQKLILPTSAIQSLDAFCSSQKVANCSFEMRDYGRWVRALFEFFKKNNLKNAEACAR